MLDAHQAECGTPLVKADEYRFKLKKHKLRGAQRGEDSSWSTRCNLFCAYSRARSV